MNENWKDVFGFENEYQVSDLGNIRSKDREIKYIQKNQYGEFEAIKHIKGKNITPRTLPNGRRRVQINGKDFYIYRLVVETFIRPLKEKEEVNHIDGNKSNDALTNLEICSRIENQNHAIKLGLNHIINKSKKNIVNRIEYNSLGECERETGISKVILSKALKNNIHEYKGKKYTFTIHEKIQ